MNGVLKMTAYKNCQSFGMPLAKDELGGGMERMERRALSTAATVI